MRLQGIITDAKYEKGISKNNGNAYERTTYTFQHIDGQNHSHLLTFALYGEKMYQEKVHKGDRIELSVQLGLREYNGNKYNEVSGVYYVGKVTGSINTQAEQPRTIPTAAPQSIQPSAPVFQQAPTQSSAAEETTELPF